MALMSFDILLNLSLSYHTRRRTGELLRILSRSEAINDVSLSRRNRSVACELTHEYPVTVLRAAALLVRSDPDRPTRRLRSALGPLRHHDRRRRHRCRSRLVSSLPRSSSTRASDGTGLTRPFERSVTTSVTLAESRTKLYRALRDESQFMHQLKSDVLFSEF